MKRISALIVLGVLVGACGVEGVTTGTGTVTTTAVATTTSSVETVVVVFAYVSGFDGASLEADHAIFLTGDEATAAAREDGEIGADETVPNDFYIRNDDPSLRNLLVSEEASVSLQTCFVDGPCITEVVVSLAQWADLRNGTTPSDMPTGWQWYGEGTLPYWLTIENGVVVKIVEQYLP